MRQGSSLTRRHLLQLGALAAGGMGLAWWLQRSAPLGRDVGTIAVAREVLADPATPAIGPALGSGDADLTMAVFTDYRCAACRAAYRGLMAAIRDDGRVRLLVKEWPIFGGVSATAARVALAAHAQGRYAAVHDRLMTDPRAFDEAVLADIVRAAGGNWARLQADLATQSAAIDQHLALTAQHAFALGVPGTPAYLIGRLLIVGALDEAEFTRAFAQAREGSSTVSPSAALG